MALALFSLWWCLIFEIVSFVLIALAELVMCLNGFGLSTMLSGSVTFWMLIIRTTGRYALISPHTLQHHSFRGQTRNPSRPVQ